MKDGQPQRSDTRLFMQFLAFGGCPDVGPLAEGWRRRVPLHQLHLLLVHTALFGASYRTAVMSAVRATVNE